MIMFFCNVLELGCKKKSYYAEASVLWRPEARGLLFLPPKKKSDFVYSPIIRVNIILCKIYNNIL